MSTHFHTTQYNLLFNTSEWYLVLKNNIIKIIILYKLHAFGGRKKNVCAK